MFPERSRLQDGDFGERQGPRFDVLPQDVVKKKPDPECYLLTAKLLGVEPAECVVFEDTHVYIVLWMRYYFTFLLGCQAARWWLARVGRALSRVFSCLSVDGPRLWPFLCSTFLR